MKKYTTIFFLFLASISNLRAEPKWIPDSVTHTGISFDAGKFTDLFLSVSLGSVNSDISDSWFDTAATGDVNGDGKLDFVGCINADSDNLIVSIFTASISASTPFSDGNILITSTTGDKFGSECAVGDMNGDGNADIAVSDIGDDEAADNGGAVYIIFGSSTLATSTIEDLVSSGGALKLTGNEDWDPAGSALSIAGDVNADGYKDLIIGTSSDSGTTYLIYGCSTLATHFCGKDSLASYTLSLTDSPIAQFTGTDDYERVGRELASTGDVNGDGYDDFLIGTTYNYAYLILGQSSQFETETLGSSNIVLETSGIGNGITLASGKSDINNDGYDDIFIGDYMDSIGGYTYNGCVYVILGSASPTSLILSSSNSLQFYRSDDSLFMGRGTGVGDVNGDGYGDFMIGNLSSDDSQGIAFLVLGKSSWAAGEYEVDTNAKTQFVLSSPSKSDHLGSFIAPAGDYNGDGYDDILIGAEAIETGLGSPDINEGAIWVIKGKRKYFSDEYELSL